MNSSRCWSPPRIGFQANLPSTKITSPKMTRVQRALPMLPSKGPPCPPPSDARSGAAARADLQQARALELAHVGSVADPGRRWTIRSRFGSASVRPAASRPTTTANSVAPSIIAAVTIIAVLIWPAASGWRAIASMALPPTRPMPRPQPITARPAPIAPPILARPDDVARRPRQRRRSWAKAAGAKSRTKPTATSIRTSRAEFLRFMASFLSWSEGWSKMAG